MWKKRNQNKIISRQAEREVNLAGEIKCAALPQDTDCVELGIILSL